jgi:2-amino-4-hydroxy-6-hydroxymethyldihydropteridine diphosphokinase
MLQLKSSVPMGNRSLCMTAARTVGTTWIAFGANQSGRWGSPRQTIARAIKELSAGGVEIIAVGPWMTTAPLPDGGRQPPYLNTVAAARTRRSARQLISFFKELERAAGRRPRRRLGPRPLDIDLLAHGITSYQWPERRPMTVTLPHPEMHTRSFVLAPLAALQPTWVHPVFGRSARQLWSACAAPRPIHPRLAGK